MMRNRAKSKFPRNLVFVSWECNKVGRPFDKHIDNRELNALVPSYSETGQKLGELSPDDTRAAESHLRFCVGCSRKVSKYRQLVNGPSIISDLRASPSSTNCPADEVDWRAVASGQVPEWKATQLIAHAALCDHCGPLLHAAASTNKEQVSQKETLLAQKKASRHSHFAGWLTAAAALVIVVGVLSAILSSPASLSGPKFAEIAVTTHQQRAQGRLALDVLSDSQQTLNEWFKEKLQFHLALPASPALPGEDRPYRLQGARLVRVNRRTTAVYVAYQMEKGPAGLLIIPSSAAVASGGVAADFKKVSFHYAMVEGYKVVTWSAHGLTYALVSDEGTETQRSCMVCHSAMRDRDLSKTPTPLYVPHNTVAPVLQ
jgi:anti-sigma factor RsiW